MKKSLNAMRIWIHPDFDPMYYGFYFEGMRRLFGAHCIKIGMSHFDGKSALSSSNKLSFRFIVEQGSSHKNISIEGDDGAGFDPVTIEWSDYVGKVNYLDKAIPPSLLGRVLPIGPSFGIRVWNSIDTLSRIVSLIRTPLTNYRRRQLFKLYLRQNLRRMPERAYRPRQSDPNYIFFLAKGYFKHADVNPSRALFMQICKSMPGLSFEGGFVLEKKGSLLDQTALPFATRKYYFEEYLEKTAHSAVVFNTPAVHGCLGWKLGEFLAMGKAIISLPLNRDMPEPLVHGKHIHFINESNSEIADAVNLLRHDHNYRRNLETNARAYYNKYLSPTAAITRLFSFAQIEITKMAGE